MRVLKYSMFVLLLMLCLTGCSTSDVSQLTTEVDKYITNIRENVKETVDSFSERANTEKESMEDLWNNRQLGVPQDDDGDTDTQIERDTEVE